MSFSSDTRRIVTKSIEGVFYICVAANSWQKVSSFFINVYKTLVIPFSKLWDSICPLSFSIWIFYVILTRWRCIWFLDFSVILCFLIWIYLSCNNSWFNIFNFGFINCTRSLKSNKFSIINKLTLFFLNLVYSS